MHSHAYPTICMKIDAVSNSIGISNVVGGTGATTPGDMASATNLKGILLSNLYKNGVTNAIVDTQNSVTLTTSPIDFYAINSSGDCFTDATGTSCNAHPYLCGNDQHQLSNERVAYVLGRLFLEARMHRDSEIQSRHCRMVGDDNCKRPHGEPLRQRHTHLRPHLRAGDELMAIQGKDAQKVSPHPLRDYRGEEPIDRPEEPPAPGGGVGPVLVDELVVNHAEAGPGGEHGHRPQAEPAGVLAISAGPWELVYRVGEVGNGERIAGRDDEPAARFQMLPRSVEEQSRVREMLDDLAGHNGVKPPRQAEALGTLDGEVAESRLGQGRDVPLGNVDSGCLGETLTQPAVQPGPSAKLHIMSGAAYVEDARPGDPFKHPISAQHGAILSAAGAARNKERAKSRASSTRV